MNILNMVTTMIVLLPKKIPEHMDFHVPSPTQPLNFASL